MDIQPHRVYDFSFDCRVRGLDDEGCIIGFWTGEVDTWGKYTIQPLDGQPLYLFADEIVDADDTDVLAPALKSQMRVL